MKRLTILVAALAATLTALGGSASGAAPAGLPTIDVSMTPTTIAVSGALQSGAVNIHSTTTSGDSEPTLVRLNPGVTGDQALALLRSKAGQDPNNVGKIGAIVFDADAPKGASDVQTTLQPGNYLAIDTSGDNPAKFPTTTFTVTQASQPASLPAANATVRGIDFAFTGPRTLHDGQVVRVENDGFVVHMIAGIGVKNAKTARKVTALLRAGKDNKAGKLATGFVSFQGPASPGAVQQGTLAAKPGIYVLACFMDTQDGREHTQIGMLRTIRIAKR